MKNEAQSLKVPKTFKLYIGGDFPRSESGRSYPVLKHGSEEHFAHLARASRKDFRNAVTAAQSALHSWESRSAYNRAQILYRMAEMTEGKREEFHEVLKHALGLSAAVANAEIDLAVDAFVYYAGYADKYQQLIGTVNPVSGPHHSFTTPEPVGIVAMLVDQGTSLSSAVARLAAVLASGNSVVALIPDALGAVIAPLAEVMATSDLPKGVVNLLTGHVSELAEQFANHMEVQSIAFHSNDVELFGRLKEMAVENLKRMIAKPEKDLALSNILSFVEYKTVWHPVGH